MRKAVEKSLSGAQGAVCISSSILEFAREADGENAASLPRTLDNTLSCLGQDLSNNIVLIVDLPEV